MSRPPGWFRLLLSLLPPAFRRSHGEAIVELAATWARDRGPLGRTLVWVRATVDVAAVALSARAPSWESVAEDARFALRSLRRERGFALFAILIVGAGVGAAVTVFSVAEALLVRPLPFQAPERLVWISNGAWERGQHLSEISVQVAYLADLREHAEQLDDVGGYHLFDAEGDHAITDDGEPTRVTRLRVTENFFSVLGVQPVLGRTFTPQEAWDDGPPALLLTHRFWTARFGADPAIVGR